MASAAAAAAPPPADDDEHDEYDEHDEAVGLLTTERTPPPRRHRRDVGSLELDILMAEITKNGGAAQSEHCPGRLRRCSSGSSSVLVLLATLVATAVLADLVHTRRRAGLPPLINVPPDPPSPVVRYECPSAPVAKSKNDKGDNFEEYVEGDAAKLSEQPPDVADEDDDDDDDDDFRQSGYDGFTIPYDVAKANVAMWKTRNFAPALPQSGGTIYESALGTGMNLLMTLEILAELANVTDLHVFGSDYVPQSVVIAQKVLSSHAPNGSRIGSICHGDSTDLYFVPSSSFDLVYTGYVDPIQDPLNLINATSGGFTVGDASRQSVQFCKSDDPTLQALAEREQEAQEDWFARWVSEMVRVVKPGGTVAVEEVARPMCDILKDWGGVAKDWWAEAAVEYGWDVDVESIRFEDAPRNPKYHGRRYNVVMRKNGGGAS